MAKLLGEIMEQPEIIRNLRRRYQDGCKELQGHIDIYLFGTGASLSACMQAKYAFLKYTGKNVTVVPACEAKYYRNVLTKNSFAAVVSQSGESYETRVICDQLMQEKVSFAAVTNEKDSYLGQSADICLDLEAGEELGTATKTHTSSLFLLYLMAAAGDRKVLSQLDKMSRALSETLSGAVEYVKDMAVMIGQHDAVYVTGLNAAAPTALQASLMLKEKIWLSCEGMALAEFRHGPVEVLREGTPVFIIGDRKDQESILCHADFLSGVCKAKVALVMNTDSRQLQGYENFPYIWDGDEELGHICATAPFQILAEHMAKDRGHDIDGFKYIGKVLNQYKEPMNR